MHGPGGAGLLSSGEPVDHVDWRPSWLFRSRTAKPTTTLATSPSFDQNSLSRRDNSRSTPTLLGVQQFTRFLGAGRGAGLRRCAIVICALVPCSLKVSPAPSQSPSAFVSVRKDEPITPIPAPPAINPLKVKLGERLFSDRRLSHDNSRSCASCHDIATNGASPLA